MALPIGTPPQIPPTPDPPSQAEERPSQPEGPQTAAAVPKCAFCGGGPDGEPPLDVLTRAQEVRKERPLSERQRARIAFEAGRLQQRRRGGVLGPLLGPLSEKVGLAGVWVHRECAIWSPEVYFHDSGHLKNVAAAVRRGRLLRCVFCQRGGPTMGCFIERCPKSYHLACARADDCFFHHEDYLITCHDHAAHRPRRARPGPGLPRPPQKRPRPWPLPIAEPQPEAPPPGRPGKRARRAAAVAAEHRISATARQDEEREAARGGDLAADEAEFLKRERRRLQRDLAEIAPLRLGGNEGGEAATAGAPPGWESVAGLRNVVDCLKEMVVFPLLYPKAFARLGGGPPRGVLLHGHPGTGKTLVARALAGACSRGPHQVAFFARKGADCLGKYVGDAERQLRLLFQVAAASAPSIIFFDEMDGLAPARAAAHADQTHASCVATLLSLLDGATPRGAVVVIAATNRPDAIDPALRRPGRFDREIFFPLPSLRDRAAILAVHTTAWEPAAPPAVLRAIAAATQGYAGADLAALAAQAALIALKRTLGGRVQTPPAQIGAPVPLPPVHVGSRDWAAALAAAPRPASRRSCLALLAAPPASPLPAPLVPLLGPPLAALLRALHADGRVALPPAARTAAEAVVSALRSAHVSSAAAQQSARAPNAAAHSGDAEVWGWANAAERAAVEALQAAGVVPRLGEQHPCRNDAWEDEELERARFGDAGARVLICGEGSLGQDALAAALVGLLEGAAGESATASLGSLVLAGYGDLHHGLSSILSDVRARRAGLLVLPRLESWACADAPSSDSAGIRAAPSAAWKMFLQQMGATPPAAAPGLILATTGLPAALLPTSVISFFGGSSTPTGPRPGITAPAEALESATWRLRGAGPGGAVGCWQLELAPGDESRGTAMLHWAANSAAAELAAAYARLERVRRRREKGPVKGEMDQLPVGVTPGTVSEQGAEQRSSESPAEGAPSADGCPEDGTGRDETLPQATPEFGAEPPVTLPEETTEPNADANANAVDAFPPWVPSALAAEAGAEARAQRVDADAPLAAALRWCGQQLLTSPQWAGLRRASAASGAEREARRRAIDPAQGAGSSPAPAAALRDATPPRAESVGGLVGVAHVACSGGFASAAELTTAVARVVARIRRREEAERGRRRRAEIGSDPEADGYSLLVAAAAALQDTVAGWEYGMARCCLGSERVTPQGTGLRGADLRERSGEGAPGESAEGGMAQGGSQGEEPRVEMRDGDTAGPVPGNETPGDGPAQKAEGAATRVVELAREPGGELASEQSQEATGEQGREPCLGRKPGEEPGGVEAESRGVGSAEATGKAQNSDDHVDGWSAECLQSVTVAVLEQYMRESDRGEAPGRDAESMERGEEPGMATQAQVSAGKERPGMPMEAVLEVVATTNRRLQAALIRIQTRKEIDACMFCRQHMEERQAENAGAVCLEPLKIAVCSLSQS